MQLDILSILQGILIEFIALIVILLFSYLWWIFYRKKKKFENYFLLAKSPDKIIPEDFLFTGYNRFYLKRTALQSDNKNRTEENTTFEDIIVEKLRNKEDVTILAKPDAGKTRCAFEVIKELPRNTIILKPPTESISIEELDPPVRTWYFKKKHYILFLDDVEDYTEKLWITDILIRLKKKNPVSILSTLRMGDELAKVEKSKLFKKDGFEHLLQSNSKIELRNLTLEEGEKIAEEIGKVLSPEFESFGTPGTITVGWGDYEKRYAALEDEFKDDGINAKLAMKAARLLHIAGISGITYIRLIAAVPAIEEPELTQNKIEKAENILKNQDIIGWDIKSRQILSGGKVLENIVKDYPLNDDSKLRHLENLMEKLEKNNDSNGLFEMGNTFHFSENLRFASTTGGIISARLRRTYILKMRKREGGCSKKHSKNIKKR